MKRTKLMAALLLTLIFTAWNAACTFANTSTVDGHLDSISGNTISGWLWDSSEPDASQTATVTVTNRSTGKIAVSDTAEANEYRTDLEKKGIGNGSYGFRIYVDWEALPAASYTVSLSCGNKTLEKTLSYSTAESEYDNLIPLGTFKTTAYCPCHQCSEGWGRLTSSGALATADHTVAVDRRVIPIGTHLLINGQEYVAQDVGGGVKGNHIDIYFNTHSETTQYGVRNAEVFIIK